MKCPGQDMQYWSEDAIYEVKCPECKAMVEFYKDDTTRKCQTCGHRFVNPKMDFGCATYCQFAEQCLGTLPEEFVLNQDNLLKDKIAVEMKRFFKNDFKNIGFATRIAHYAEKIGKATEGSDLAAILCSSLLLTIGYQTASAKSPDVSKKDLEATSPAVARDILKKLGAKEELISAVCAIIGNDTSSNSIVNHLSQTIVNDAYYIALLEQEIKRDKTVIDGYEEALARILTEAGKKELSGLCRTV